MVNSNALTKTQVNWHISAYQASQLSVALQTATSKYVQGLLTDWFVRLKAIRTQFLDHELFEQTKAKYKRKNPDEIVSPKIQELDEIQHDAEKALSKSRYYAMMAETKYLDKDKLEFVRKSRKKHLEFYQGAEKLHKLIMIRLKEVGYMPNKEQRWRVGF